MIQPPEETLADQARIDAALARAVREALLAHARAGRAVPTWRDGQVVWVQPAEILAQYAPPPQDANGPTESSSK
jgi:hypothetical protein